MIRTFFFKLAAMLLLVCALQVLVYMAQVRAGLGYPSSTEAMYRVITGKQDVLYLGDSTLTFTSSRDQVKKSIPELLGEQLPGKRVETINSGAYHAGTYHSIGKRLIEDGDRGTVLVVPVNPRSFPAAWDMRPEYQFPRETLLLDHDNFLLRVFYKPLSIFKMFNTVPVTREEFDKLPVHYEGKLIGTIRDFRGKEGKGDTPEERMRNKIIYHYMTAITGRHRKVVSFQELARALSRARVKAVFYITPVDYQRCGRYLGPAFLTQLRKNISVVRGAIEAEGYPVMDLSEELSSDQFLGEEEPAPNEHLRAQGRAFVARRVAEKIRAFNP